VFAAKERVVMKLTSVLIGAGAGAAAMFFMDPKQGEKRRQALKQSAMSALDQADTALHSGLGHLRDATSTTKTAFQEKVAQLSESLQPPTYLQKPIHDALAEALEAAAAVKLRSQRLAARPAAKLSETLSDRLNDALSSARDMFHGARRSATSHASDLVETSTDYVKNLLPTRLTNLRRSKRRSRISTSDVALIGLGCAVVAAGSLYFFDARQGRSRRAYVAQKSGRAVREVGTFMRGVGRHVGNRVQGYAARSTRMLRNEIVSDEQLAERVRSTIGRVTTYSSAIDVVVRDGHVTLQGNLPEPDRDAVLYSVMSLRGVRGVENQLVTGNSSIAMSS
jgi:gas vesicle protein